MVFHLLPHQSASPIIIIKSCSPIPRCRWLHSIMAVVPFKSYMFFCWGGFRYQWSIRFAFLSCSQLLHMIGYRVIKLLLVLSLFVCLVLHLVSAKLILYHCTPAPLACFCPCMVLTRYSWFSWSYLIEELFGMCHLNSSGPFPLFSMKFLDLLSLLWTCPFQFFYNRVLVFVLGRIGQRY